MQLITGTENELAERHILSLFSAGTPMFFMGEEIGAQKPYTYNSFMGYREDILGERYGNGAKMFQFYQEAIRFSRRHPAVRVQYIDILHVNDDARVIAFRRETGSDELLVVASLNNHSFGSYDIVSDASRLPDGQWCEVFNSDAAAYGGSNVGNGGGCAYASNGHVQLCIPANAFIVLAKV